jgi:tetratricopeptide (TPR) repeat protein
MLQQTLQQAVQLHRAGQLAEAERLYAQLLSQQPQMFEALHLMGLVRLQQNRPREAIAFMERALKLRAGAPETLTNYGLALVSLGRPAEALPVLEQVASASPGNGAVRSNIGGVLQQLGRNQEALAVLDQALAIAPRDAGALTNRGMALQALDRTQEAVDSFTQALAVQPTSLQALNARGLAHRALNRHAAALADFESILRDHPGHLGAQTNRAATLWSLGRVDDALAAYDAVLAADPDMVDALASRANLYWTAKMTLGPALADTERLAALVPERPGVKADLLHMRLYAGDWRDFASVKAALDAGVRAGRAVVDPFIYQGLSDSPADLLACARRHAESQYPAQKPVCAPGAKRRSGRIRLGYVCG